MIGEAFAGQMEQQEAMEEQTRAAQRKMSADMESVRSELLKRFTSKGKKHEYPQEIQNIADALLMQPRLIGPVSAFLQALIGKIDAAVNSAIKEVLGVETGTPPTSGE